MKAILITTCLLFSIHLFSQNVGIGTTSPESTLHIFNANTNTNNSPLIIESNSSFGSPTYSGIEFRANANGAGTGPSGRIKSYYLSPFYTSARMIFQTIAAGPSFVDAMTLTNGTVGIGTTSPVNKLDLAGNLAIGSTYAGTNIAPANGAIIEGNLGIGLIAPETSLHIKSANSNANSSMMIIEANSNFGPPTYSGIEFRANANAAGTGPSGRIKTYYTSPSYSSATMVFQTISGGPTFTDALTLTNGNASLSGTLNANGVTLPTTGGGASVLNYYEEATFSVTATNFSATTTYIASYLVKAVRLGNMVTLTFPNDATSLTIINGGVDIKLSAVPVRFRPATNQYFTILQRNGSIDGVGLAFVRTVEGDILIKPSAATSTGNWNGSGNCGFYAFSISYTIS